MDFLHRYNPFGVLLLLLSSTLLTGQNRILTRQILPEKISSLPVKCILEDRYGFIWYGSSGLYRYDGSQSKKYMAVLEDSSVVSIGNVYDILEERNGDLLLAASTGLFRYERETDQILPHFRNQLKDRFGEAVPLRSLHKDRSGRIWLGGKGKLYLMEGLEEETVREVLDMGLGFQGYWGVNAILEAEDSRIYCATTNGLILVDKDLAIRTFIPKEYVGVKKDFRLLGAQMGGGDTLWLGGIEGLWIYEMQKERFTLARLNSIEVELVRQLFVDQQQRLWFATKDKVLIRDPAGHFRLMSDGADNLLSGIFAITQDRFGNIWAGGNNGLALLDAPLDQTLPFYRINENPATQDNYFFRVMQDSSGGFWFRMFRSGLGYCPGLEGPFEIVLQPSYNATIEEIKDFCTDPDGNVWVLTLTHGLFLFESGRPQYRPADLGDSMRYSMAMAIISDQQDGRLLWFSSEFGLCSVDRFSYKREWFYPKEDLPWLDLNGARQIHQAEDGTIWCALQANGNALLGYLDKKSAKFKAQREPPGIPDLNRIYQLRQGPNQTMLAATDKGLIIVDVLNKTQSFLGPGQGLPMSNVQSLMPDREGNIWIASDQQLCKYDGRGFECYRTNPGIGSFAHTSSTLTREGLLAFGGLKGLHVFDPEKLQKDTLLPKVYLTNFKVFNKQRTLGTALELVREIRLPYREKVFTLEFSAPHFVGAGNTSYKYKLEGFDREWAENGNERQVIYTNLSPGKYRFKVLASGGNGLWSSEADGLSLDIRILPPWYQTSWAWVLWIGIPLAILFTLYQFQLHRRLAQAEALRLKEVSEIKSNLYTNITHEFRTPLTVIQGMADQIRADPANWLDEGLTLIQRNSKQLLKLVNELLDLSKLEARQMSLNMALGEVVGFLRYLSESFHSFCEIKDIRLHFFSNPENLLMDYDPEKLQVVMSNLFSNAIKFTPEGGNVYVHITESNSDCLEIIVQDTGIGIAPEHLPHIFKRFYQADASSTRTGEGTGIGLALAEELIRAMGGSISVESNQDITVANTGTKFTILLPITRNAHQKAPRQQAEVQPALAASLVLDVGQEQQNLRVDKDDRNLVLLIEDNRDVLTYLRSFLSGNYHIVTATNGQQGIELAFEVVPDLIVSDVMMPKMDGMEVCRIIKADERTSHIPIILLTAKADKASEIKGLSEGADAYLAKPFSREELMVRIEKLIALRRILQKQFQQNGAVSKLLDKPAQTANEAFMQKVLRLIEGNYKDERFGMPQLCEKMHMSRSNLFRKIKALTGKPTTHLIRAVRLEKAKELLQTSPLNVSEISFEVGFSHPTYFTTLFGEAYGLSPTEYRAKHQ